MPKAERPSFRAAYAESHPHCELALHIPEFRVDGNPYRKADECNHIFSAGGRHDLASNLIRLSWQNHHWFHRFPTDGRICCLWVKNETQELDPDEIRTASGMFLPGWLVCHEATHEFVTPYLILLRKAYP